MSYHKEIALIFILIFLPFSICAHPLDISFSTIQFDESYLYGTTYIHPYEISLLAEDNNLSINNITEKQLNIILIPYFNEHFKIYGKNGILSKDNISIQNTETYQLLSSGVYINFVIRINREIFPITFCVDLFIEYFSTQTNKIIIIDNSGQPLPGSNEVYLTAKVKEWSFDIYNPDFSAYDDDYTDTDNDGLTDHFEKLYGLDPFNSDTDKDGYSDFDEFSFGWDPFNSVPSPGQSQKALQNNPYNYSSITESASDAEINTEPDESAPIDNNDIQPKQKEKPDSAASEVEPKNLIEEHSVTDKNIPDSSFLEKTLQQMEEVFTGDFNLGGIIVLFFSVFILGFLHAAMPGHGKGILIAYLAEKNKTIYHGFGFILTFTITHLIDVIILALGSSIFLSTVNTASAAYILRVIGGTGLVIIAIYMIYKGIRILKGNRNINKQVSNKTRKGALLMGILTGLAPCPFGWAILMMLLSIGKLEMVPLIILFFGLGIFIFLLIMTILVIIIRRVTFDLFKKFEKYSMFVSGIFVLVFGILFFLPKVIF